MEPIESIRERFESMPHRDFGQSEPLDFARYSGSSVYRSETTANLWTAFLCGWVCGETTGEIKGKRRTA